MAAGGPQTKHVPIKLNSILKEQFAILQRAPQKEEDDWITSIEGDEPLVAASDDGEEEVSSVHFSEVAYSDFVIPATTKFKWGEKYLASILKKKEELKNVADKEKIEANNKDLDKMVFAAKNGEWEDVFQILAMKPFLINRIPKARAWSVLHQAVYLNNYKSVSQLLEYKDVDAFVKTKLDRSGDARKGDNPLHIAQRYDHIKDEIKHLIWQKQAEQKAARHMFPPFASDQQQQSFVKDGIPYFLMATAFMHRDMVEQLHIEDADSFLELTSNIYSFAREEWKYVTDLVRDCLYPLHSTVVEDDMLGNVTDADNLFEKLIYIYTEDVVFSKVNTGLLRASHKMKPTEDDMILSPYALFLEVILIHWEDLEKYGEKSYRGTCLTDDQLKSYKKNTRFVWLPFTSSSEDEEQAKCFMGDITCSNEYRNVLFVIDNTKESLWSPRQIESYSSFENEKEVLYPAGAKFKVTKVTKVNDIQEGSHYIEIHLQLQAYIAN